MATKTNAHVLYKIGDFVKYQNKQKTLLAAEVGITITTPPALGQNSPWDQSLGSAFRQTVWAL